MLILRKSLKSLKAQLEKYMSSQPYLHDCLTCIYGNSTSTFNIFTIDPPALEEYLAGSEDSDWAPRIIENGYFDNHNLVNNKLIQN